MFDILKNGNFMDFWLFFFGLVFQVLRLLLKGNEVTTEHQKRSKTSKKKASFFRPLGRSRLQELELSLRSGLYLLDM